MRAVVVGLGLLALLLLVGLAADHPEPSYCHGVAHYVLQVCRIWLFR